MVAEVGVGTGTGKGTGGGRGGERGEGGGEGEGEGGGQQRQWWRRGDDPKSHFLDFNHHRRIRVHPSRGKCLVSFH